MHHEKYSWWKAVVKNFQYMSMDKEGKKYKETDVSGQFQASKTSGKSRDPCGNQVIHYTNEQLSIAGSLGAL